MPNAYFSPGPVGQGSQIYGGPGQEYGLTGIKRRPYYSDIVSTQARGLSALYALKGAQRQKDRELLLAEEALTKNLAIEKEKLAQSQKELEQNKTLAYEQLDTTKKISESETAQREQLAKEQLAQEKSQAAIGNVISGVGTGVSLATGAAKAIDWWKKKAAEEAAKKAADALVGPSSSTGSVVASEVAPELIGEAGYYGVGSATPYGEGVAADYLMGTPAVVETAPVYEGVAADYLMGTTTAVEGGTEGLGLAAAPASAYALLAAPVIMGTLGAISDDARRSAGNKYADWYQSQLTPRQLEVQKLSAQRGKEWADATMSSNYYDRPEWQERGLPVPPGEVPDWFDLGMKIRPEVIQAKGPGSQYVEGYEWQPSHTWSVQDVTNPANWMSSAGANIDPNKAYSFKEEEMGLPKGGNPQRNPKGSCCFIALASYDMPPIDPAWKNLQDAVVLAGVTYYLAANYLHPVIRKFRDEHLTTRNKRGYYWLADRLVPWMKKSRLGRFLVRWGMVNPMTSYGKYFYGVNRVGAVFAPITKFWLTMFDLLGRRPPYQRRGTDEIV